MRTLLLFLFLFSAGIGASAKSSLSINNPQVGWQFSRGNLSGVVCEVWPNGAYAQVELTFTIATAGAQSQFDSLESVLDFELPEGSFIHNSWLWLDAHTIIQAAIIERGRAVSIYEGIVKRRRDPSLLQQSSAEQFSLNVFPLTTTYPRKVRIFYSVPFNWQHGAANFALPVSLLNTSLAKPDVQLILHTNSIYTSPRLLENSISSIITGTAPNTTFCLLPGTMYGNRPALHVAFAAANTGGAILTTYPTSTTSGVYQVVVNPGVVASAHAPRHTTILLDLKSTAPSIFSLPFAIDQIRSHLLANFNATDSFALFYAHNNVLVKAGGAGWRATDSANVTSLLASVPLNLTSDLAKIEHLLKDGLAHAATKPAAQSEALIFSNNSSITQQSVADTIFNRVQAHLGGSFPTRVNVMNYSSVQHWISNAYVNGGDILWTKLAIAAGGNRYTYTSRTYTMVNGVNTYHYEFPVATFLKHIARHTGYNTSFYDVALPVGSGFSYAWHDVHGHERWSTAAPYVETGLYSGQIQTQNPINVQYIGPSGPVTLSMPITTVFAGDAMLKKAWVYNHLARLIKHGSQTYNAEIIDSSIRNRVLCQLTAFLALETGDTVNASVNGTPQGSNPTSIPSAEGDEVWVSCSPNPFAGNVTISFKEIPDAVEILDVTGRSVWKGAPTGKVLQWNGHDAAGRPLPSGTYLVRATFKGRVVVVKLQRL